MADYMTLATIHILVGFEIYGLQFLVSPQGTTEEAMFIIAFLLYLTATILTILIKGGGLGGNKIAVVATIILLLVAALFILVGVIVYADDVANPEEYTMTLLITGMAMAIIGGIFLIVSAVGGAKTGP